MRVELTDVEVNFVRQVINAFPFSGKRSELGEILKVAEAILVKLEVREECLGPQVSEN